MFYSEVQLPEAVNCPAASLRRLAAAALECDTN